MSRWLAVLFVAFAWPSTAYADLVAPGAHACDDKPLGGTCEMPLGGKGVCKQTTCSKLDYSQGTPPKTKEYSCLRCLPAPAKPAPPKDAGTDASAAPSSEPSVAPSSAPSSEPSAAPSSEPSGQPTAPAPSATPPATNVPVAEPTKQGACHASPGAAHAASAWALVAGVARGAGARARRRGKR